MRGLVRAALGCLVLCGGVVLPCAAGAASKTAAIFVSAHVVASCEITVSAVARTGSARCSQGAPYRFVTRVAPAETGAGSKGVGGTIARVGQAATQIAEPGLLVMTFIF